MMTGTRAHWETVWIERDPGELSWYQIEPNRSLELIALAGAGPDDPIADIGAGASPLAAALVRRGHRDVTVVDIAQAALDRLATVPSADPAGHRIRLVRVDVLDWRPSHTVAVWHDRALNHFLTDPDARLRYADAASAIVRPGGHVVLGAFAPDGPDRCSGLPVHRTDPASLAAEFAPSFELLSVTREYHHTPWHATQSFQYLLLRRR